MTYDLLIRNGRIVDGSGMPAFRGDVAVKDGKIAEIGTQSIDPFTKEIGAAVFRLPCQLRPVRALPLGLRHAFRRLHPLAQRSD